MRYVTWADHESETGRTRARVLRRARSREGPSVRCCKRPVAADQLVLFAPDDTVTPEAWARVRARFPHLPERGAYLCDGCRETLRRERVLNHEVDRVKRRKEAQRLGIPEDRVGVTEPMLVGPLSPEEVDQARDASEFPSWRRDPTCFDYQRKNRSS